MNLMTPDETKSVSPPPLPRKQRILIVAGVFCVLLLIVLGVGAWSFQQTQNDRILPGVSIHGVDLGGLTKQEALTAIERATHTAPPQDIRVRFQDRTFSLGSPWSLMHYNIPPAVEYAYAFGRTGTPLERLLAPLQARMFGQWFDTGVTFDEAALTTKANTVLEDILSPTQDAQLVFANDATSTIRIEAERPGRSIDINQLSIDIERAVALKQTEPILLQVHEEQPSIRVGDLEPLIPQATTWLERTPFTLLAEDTRLTITRAELAAWIKVNTSTQPLVLDLDRDRLAADIRRQASVYIKPAKDGRIELDAENKAKAFETPQEGVDIDIDATAYQMLEGLTSGSSTISIVFTNVTPRILGDGERLGIREVIGVGRSNFSGSPTNRRKNIALGAQRVNFTLVPPGEEFSMIKTLGSIDGEHGWLPELVIKGNKTLPEFGGGLCQVGTTMFRAALASGMPITERRNHSYRVRYYEPAGTDATIYEPSPDFKFKNDTTNWLMITTRVVQNDNLEFTVWGTNDGRKVEQTKSRVFNIVPAPPKKIIETTEIPVGQEKCTESAHAGADAEFDYTVTYPDGNVVKKTFFSRYRPWQAVCLKGVAQLTQPTDTTVDETGVNNPNL